MHNNHNQKATHRKPVAISLALLAATMMVVAAIFLTILHNSSLKYPGSRGVKSRYGESQAMKKTVSDNDPNYSAIAERNLFGASVQAQAPRERTAKEIEEELLSNTVRGITVKGVWVGSGTGDSYAVIDRGAQRGALIYRKGDEIEHGLKLSEVRLDSVVVRKEAFSAVLELFKKSAPAPAEPLTASARPGETMKAGKGQKPEAQAEEVIREGNRFVVPKAVVDKARADGNAVLSSVAVKAILDAEGKPGGYTVVAVDKGSLAEKAGLMPNDTIKEINGLPVLTPEDFNNLRGKLQDETRFEVKVLRNGVIETLYYEVR